MLGKEPRLNRRYHSALDHHFSAGREMVFLGGPRRVGKTYTSLAFDDNALYLNWDNQDDRGDIISGPRAVAGKLGTTRTLILDEIHKYPKWRDFLKGFYDTYAQNRLRILVTGSGMLNVFQRSGDSLMGRYFYYRMHPLSVAELANPTYAQTEISPPSPIDTERFDRLLKFGGFPEPFTRNNTRFYNQWRRTRSQLLFRDDLRDLTRIQEIAQVEVLAELIKRQTGQLANYTALANRVGASQDSIRRWIQTLESLFYCFTIRPWSRNVSRSLRKDPKIYLWDWSINPDVGSLHENFVASHLLKAIHWWEDTGFGQFGLHYLRTKDKREVDFLVTKNDKPWFMVEVKTSATKRTSTSLDYFHQRIGTEHAFQLSFAKPSDRNDCFDITHPVTVSASTFLSQLV